MSSLAAGNHVGDAVTILWDVAGETRVAYGHVAAEVPFAVSADFVEMPELGTEVHLVRDQGDRLVSGVATVAMAEEGVAVLRKVIWEEPNRRQHARHAVDWPATIRTLDDKHEQPITLLGQARDVSVGGAAVHVANAPDVGTLVELKALPPDGTPLRAVAVVVRRQGDDIGLAYLFLWASARMRIQELAA